MLGITQLSGFGATVNRPRKTFLERREDEGNLSTYTFSSVNFGEAFMRRRIVVGIVGSQGTNNRTITSVTIGGVAASIAVQANNSGRRVGLAWASVPTGTSGDVVVTFDGAEDRCVIFVWSANETNPPITVTDTANSVATPLNLSIDLTPLSLVFAVAFSAAATSATWVGLTEDSDANFSSQEFTAASLEGTTYATPLTVTCTFGTATQAVGVAMAFG